MIDLLRPMVEIEHLHKRFGAETAVQDFNLSITEGEFVTLLGPSVGNRGPRGGESSRAASSRGYVDRFSDYVLALKGFLG